ncbi:transcriptional regulator [Pseudactinotalea sp.]|uniref:transcriptional regulator n=1 Tax=Pseudactinotalea sp. TaxID=1926260 RepID=UPI003B3B869C
MTEAELDPVIHAQSRLRVVATLAGVAPGDQIVFTRLQKVLGMTAGNLSTHLRKLEDAEYVTVQKAFEGRSPVTSIALTPRGRHAFETYTASLEALLKGAIE